MLDLKKQIQSEFEKHASVSLDTYDELHEFEIYLQNMINTNGDVALNIINNCIFNYPSHYESIIMGICVYCNTAKKNSKYYSSCIKMLKNLAIRNNNSYKLTTCIVSWLYNFTQDDTLIKILDTDINNGLKDSISLYLLRKEIKKKFNQFDQYEENLIDNMIGICYQSNFKHTTNTLDERNNMVDESIKKFGVKQTIKILKFVSNNKLCQKQASNNLKSIINNTSNTSVKFNVIPS